MSAKMNRREFLPLAGAGAIMAPTIITGCSSPTEPGPLYVPGTITFERETTSGRNIYITDWTGEAQINLTEQIPGNHGRPFWGPDGFTLYFDTELDGENYINRISDLTNPAGSLERVVDEAGYQFQPIVHSNGNLIVYRQKANLSDNEGKLVAYDMGSNTVISMSESTTGLVNDYRTPEDLKFLAGERRVLFTGAYPSVGIFDPDTGGVEHYEFQSNPRELVPDSLAVSSQNSIYATGLGFGQYDSLFKWDFEEKIVNRFHVYLERARPRARIMADLIELPKEHILLFSCRPGLPSATSPWLIGYTNLGDPEGAPPTKVNTLAFENMLGDNYWPRYTTVEHIST
ncbi:TolB family protein [Candidatus Zixiibacteriota bacterium]